MFCSVSTTYEGGGFVNRSSYSRSIRSKTNDIVNYNTPVHARRSPHSEQLWTDLSPRLFDVCPHPGSKREGPVPPVVAPSTTKVLERRRLKFTEIRTYHGQWRRSAHPSLHFHRCSTKQSKHIPPMFFIFLMSYVMFFLIYEW